MVEIWKDVVGYEGLYQVSSLGRVKSFKCGRERILKGLNNGRGYYRVNLYKNRKLKNYKIHRLVSIAFIPNPDNKPQINHIDGNKANNRADNLEWCTHKENINHAEINGLIDNKGEKSVWSKLTNYQVLEIREKYSTGKYTYRELHEEYNISMTSICFLINRKIWKHI